MDFHNAVIKHLQWKKNTLFLDDKESFVKSEFFLPENAEFEYAKLDENSKKLINLLTVSERIVN